MAMTSVFNVFAISVVGLLASCSSQSLCERPSPNDVGPGYPVVYTTGAYEEVEDCNYRAAVTWDWQLDATALPATILTRNPEPDTYVGTIVFADESRSRVMAHEMAERWDAWLGPNRDAQESRRLLSERVSADTENGVVRPATAQQALTSGAWRNEPRPPAYAPTPAYEKHFPAFECDDTPAD
jgi:hypothetical protein